MESISVEQRSALLDNAREMLKIELRDDYAIDAAELEAWRAGDIEAARAPYLEWAKIFAADLAPGAGLPQGQGGVRTVVRLSADGGGVQWGRRGCRGGPAVAAPAPGLGRRVAGQRRFRAGRRDGHVQPDRRLQERAGFQMSREPEVVKFCRDAFDVAYSLGIPHHEYQPE